MQHSAASPQTIERGPSWEDHKIKAPVAIFRQMLAPQHSEQEHKLSRYQFSIQLGSPAQVELLQDGKRATGILHFGDLTWTPAGDSCRGIWHQPREVGFVTLSGSFVQQTADEVGVSSLPNQAFFKFNDPLMRELVLALVNCESEDRLYRESLASTLTVHLLRTIDIQGRKYLPEAGKLTSRQLQLAIDYVEGRLNDEIELQSWAKEVGMSLYHFARLFKRTTGLAPHQFVLQRRVERAKSILAASDTPFSAVAYDLGFASQSHFNRVFRQYTQMTPGEWRSSRQ